MAGWNEPIIREFRENGGKVGHAFAGRPLLLLHHRGAHSGVERVNPLAYQDLGKGSVAVFASKGGAPTNPDWYYNLLANPEVTVEVGTETYPGRARLTGDDERTEIWERQKAVWPGFADYEKKTSRQIPVFVIDRSA